VKNNYFYQKPLANIYAKPSKNSEVISQIIFGEKFKILSRKNNWLKIKTIYDNYNGFLKNNPQSPFNQSTSAPEEEASVVLPAVPIEASSAY